MENISSCDENRLAIAEKADKSLDLGRKLASEGKYKKALEHYLFAFDNGRYVSGWAGVRLSYIPSEIAELGSKYPAALDALRERRDDREALILKGGSDYDVAAEWLSLNRYLGDNERMLSMLDHVGEKVRAKIIDANFEQLLSSKRYKLLSSILNERGRRFFSWELHYETEKYFPRNEGYTNWQPGTMLLLHAQTLRQSGLEVFELSLALKRNAPALEVARRLLVHFCDAETYIALLEIARRIGSKRIAAQLLKQAKSQLTAEDFERVRGETGVGSK